VQEFIMPNTVQIVPNNGKFTVRIVEDGEIAEREFEFEQHAQAFAKGQSLRLEALEEKQWRVDGAAELVPGITLPSCR
jgi:hypothetical protein